MRYFFNIRDGEKISRDPEGSELSDLVAARFEARIIARDMMIERLKAGREQDGQEIEIADETGNVVQTLKVKEVISAPKGVCFL